MTRESLRDFITHHDDRWLFVVVYITLAVVLSIMLSLFWLVAVAALHFGLEYARQAQYRSGVVDTVSHALWEIKLDIALVLLALAMALYMEVILGVLGLQSAARAAAASRIARFAAWERNLRAMILLSDDIARVVHIGWTRLLRRPAREPREAREAREARDSVVLAAAAQDGAAAAVPASAAGAAGAGAAAVPASWRDSWSFGDRFVLGLLAASALLIVFAPLWTQHTWGGAALALLGELHPFPPR